MAGFQEQSIFRFWCRCNGVRRDKSSRAVVHREQRVRVEHARSRAGRIESRFHGWASISKAVASGGTLNLQILTSHAHVVSRVSCSGQALQTAEPSKHCPRIGLLSRGRKVNISSWDARFGVVPMRNQQKEMRMKRMKMSWNESTDLACGS